MDIKIILASNIFRAFICKFACWLTISSEQALNFFQILGANKINRGLLWIEVESFLKCLPQFLCSEATREVSVYFLLGGSGGRGARQGLLFCFLVRSLVPRSTESLRVGATLYQGSLSGTSHSRFYSKTRWSPVAQDHLTNSHLTRAHRRDSTSGGLLGSGNVLWHRIM